MKIVTNGCFDLLHEGHKHILKTALNFSFHGELYVLLNSDDSVKELKGLDRPFEDFYTRRTRIYSCLSQISKSNINIVVQVIKFESEEELKFLMDEIKPDLIVKGNDGLRTTDIVGSDRYPLLIVPKIKDEEGKEYSTSSKVKGEIKEMNNDKEIVEDIVERKVLNNAKRWVPKTNNDKDPIGNQSCPSGVVEGFSEIVPKEWGAEYIIFQNPHACKVMLLLPGTVCSNHFHKNKSETFVLIQGKLCADITDLATGNKQTVYLETPFSSITLLPEMPHSFYVPEDQECPTIFIEASTKDHPNDNYRFTKSRR